MIALIGMIALLVVGFAAGSALNSGTTGPSSEIILKTANGEQILLVLLAQQLFCL